MNKFEQAVARFRADLAEIGIKPVSIGLDHEDWYTVKFTQDPDLNLFGIQLKLEGLTPRHTFELQEMYVDVMRIAKKLKGLAND